MAVSGYKSLYSEQAIDIRPLTILAGANSSGKSSIMQPLLLLKQTLEATFDPGPLLLNGPVLSFTSADQFLSKPVPRTRHVDMTVSLSINRGPEMSIHFARPTGGVIEIAKFVYSDAQRSVKLRLGMSDTELRPQIPKYFFEYAAWVLRKERQDVGWTVVRERCFLAMIPVGADELPSPPFALSTTPGVVFEPHIRRLIHLPGLRGNPARVYPLTAVGANFPGDFEPYTASVIAKWQDNRQQDKLAALGKDLERLGLTWIVTATRTSETEVRLQVGRLPQPAKTKNPDMVNIVDVGSGVSQTLPVLVALHVAAPGQIVYLEQPEIHLHPRSQSMLSLVLADAAKRGVRVICETHSSLLLRGIQTLVAAGELDPSLVKLHWFRRDSRGRTEVTSADVDSKGSFGEWPEDFSEVELQSDRRYLDAALDGFSAVS